MKLVSSASLIIGAALSLAACGQNNKSATKSAKKFPEQTAQKTAKKGAATFKLNKNAKTVTITVKKDVKWSDGKPLNIHFLAMSGRAVQEPIMQNTFNNGEKLVYMSA